MKWFSRVKVWQLQFTKTVVPEFTVIEQTNQRIAELDNALLLIEYAKTTVNDIVFGAVTHNVLAYVPVLTARRLITETELVTLVRT